MQEGSMNQPARSAREHYTRPELKCWGTVADLTRAGGSNPGEDFKFGSNLAQGPPDHASDPDKRPN